MVQRTPTAAANLYETDETAWLDATAELLRQGRLAEVDAGTLAEYLTDMALRDRREVVSRLVILLTHVLKWTHQPGKRSRSWRGTIIGQRQELNRLVGRGVLRNHAGAVLAEAYLEAIDRAMGETGLPAATFPPACPYTLGELLSTDVTAEDA